MLNLRERRLELGLTMLEVAQAVGVSEAAISRYENGSIKNMRRDRIIKYANALQVEPTEFLKLDDSTPESEPSLTTQPEYRGFAVLDHDNIYMIPIYRTVSAGYGAFADEYIIGYEPVYLSSQKEAEETFAVVVKGDSMLPRIDEDDIAIVHKQDCFENGDIVIAIQCGNGDGFIKRAFLRKDKLSLESFNPNYPVMTFTGPEIESIKIIGVVKKIIKSV